MTIQPKSVAPAAIHPKVEGGGAKGPTLNEPSKPFLDALTRVAGNDRAQELKERVTKLVDERFGGEWRRAFDAYAGSDGGINENELNSLLEDIGYGPFERWVGTGKVMDELDRNGDRKIQWKEFNDARQENASTGPSGALKLPANRGG